MRLGFAGVFADAGALWRAERDLLARIAAVFFFLPGFAMRLFVPDMVASGGAPEDQVAALLDWLAANWAWLAGTVLIETLGLGVVLVLLLDPGRPRLGEALGRAAALLPVLVVATLAEDILAGAGLMLFILPGLYLAGRMLITAPLLMAGPGRNPFAAVAVSIERTRGNGWVLFLVTASVGIATSFAGSVLDSIGVALAAVPFADVAVAAAIGFVVAGGMLAQVLLQVAAYRALVPRQGI